MRLFSPVRTPRDLSVMLMSGGCKKEALKYHLLVGAERRQ
jgi:hypothetical protein